MASRWVEWSIIACFPAGIFILLGALEIPNFGDPCHTFGGSEPSNASTPSPDPTCVGRTSTNETRQQAMTRLVLFQGTTFMGLVVAVAGAARRNTLVAACGTGLLVLISIPLMLSWAFLYPLLSAVLFAIGILLYRPRDRPASGRPRQ